MKKSTLAVGIIAILGIGYVGTAWYTGNIIETNIDSKLEQITEIANKYQDDFTVKFAYSNYEKHIFSTKMHLTITLSPIDSPNDSINLFNDDITIHHGPFPIAALSKGCLTPQMAWIDYTMTEQAYPELWKLAGNKPLITGHAGVSYGQYLTVALANEAITMTNAQWDGLDGKLDLSEGNYTFESNSDASSIKSTANLDKFVYQLNDKSSISLNKLKLSAQPNSEKGKINYEISFDNFKTIMDDFDIQGNVEVSNVNSKGVIDSNDVNMDIETTFDKFTFIPTGKYSNFMSQVELQKFDLKQKSVVNSTNTVDGSTKSTIGSIILGQQNLGSTLLDLDFKGVDKRFIFSNINESYSYNSDASSNRVNTKVTLNKFNFHNASGDINMTANIDISGVDSDDLTISDIDNINALQFNLHAPFDVMARFAAQMDNPKSNEVTPDQLSKANQTVQIMAKMFLSGSDAFVFNNGNTKGVFSDIDFSKDKDEVLVNGKTIAKDEFLNNL